MSRCCTPLRTTAAPVRPARVALMVGGVKKVLGFRSSSKLAAAYGIAVTTTIGRRDNTFSPVVARNKWGWSMLKTAVVVSAAVLRGQRLPGHEHPEDPPRRLVPPARRGRPARPDGHVASGSSAGGRTPSDTHQAQRGSSVMDEYAKHSDRARRGGVPLQGLPPGAPSPHQQPERGQGPTREHVPRAHRHDRRPARRRRGAPPPRSAAAGPAPGHPRHGIPRRDRRPRRARRSSTSTGTSSMWTTPRPTSAARL